MTSYLPTHTVVFGGEGRAGEGCWGVARERWKTVRLNLGVVLRGIIAGARDGD